MVVYYSRLVDLNNPAPNCSSVALAQIVRAKLNKVKQSVRRPVELLQFQKVYFCCTHLPVTVVVPGFAGQVLGRRIEVPQCLECI